MTRTIRYRAFLAVIACAAAFAVSASAASLVLTSGLTVNRNTPFNLITNGSFEDGPGAPDAATPSKYWATGTTLTPFAVPPGWSSIGDTAAYARWTYDTIGPRVLSSAILPHGNRGVYFGNQFCSAISQSPTFNNTTGEVTFPNPATLVITPKGPGYLQPVQLSQTVSGLNTNAIYKFSFWTSGEQAGGLGGFNLDGIFGLDVTGFNTVYLAAPSGGAGGVGSSKLYEFYLNPAASTTTLTWTNWGHYGIGQTAGWTLNGLTDELVLDDVVLNFDRLVPEPATVALLSLGSLFLLRRRASRSTSPRCPGALHPNTGESS